MKIFPATQPIESPQAISKRLPVSIWNPRIWTMNKAGAFERGVTDGKQRKGTERKMNIRMFHACITTNLNKTGISQVSLKESTCSKPESWVSTSVSGVWTMVTLGMVSKLVEGRGNTEPLGTCELLTAWQRHRKTNRWRETRCRGKAALFSHQLPMGKEKTGSTWSLNRVLPAEEENPDSMTPNAGHTGGGAGS